MVGSIPYVGIRGIQPDPKPFQWYRLDNPLRNPNYPGNTACGIAVDEHANGANIEVSTTTGEVWETFCSVNTSGPSLDCGSNIMPPASRHPWVQITPGPTSAPFATAVKSPTFKNPPAKKPAVKKPAAKPAVAKGNKHRG
ncbi:hypothetical protein ACFXD5_08865 [Streptomyces sp. NPDC059385]|uniref:hypothetical protein n=1 Tax=Streptomyces sp. NPDC059385 TaxID=3346817 RepID=UPI0036CADBA0